ncbi:MAG: 1-deoxy-D-xylulose-5-phosphate reductoisomerase [Nanoarchaeota archaeon]|nr:1-deoxy-D-xylulose-5-phosphate reductoisomerase [Nanoarchaeota archaeon]
MKRLVILGSTGSIGQQALDIVRSHPSEFKVVGLSCHSNVKLLKEQMNEFKPEMISVYDKEKAEMVSAESGMAGLKRIASLDGADTVLNSLVGSIGVEPTVEAIKAGKEIALANKETLVSAGSIVMDLARKHKVEIKPIDSEHSAIFQCAQTGDKIRKIMITCSGGPFMEKTIDEMKNLKAADALKHPNWSMGKKITIDSATLMNKGFEVIEAHMLFGLSYDDIKVVVHPQSIIHSLVEFEDSSVLAQLGWPDMKIPIQYALSHPKRMETAMKPLDLVKVGKLTFDEPDLERFPCLGYAYEAGRIGGSMPCVMNAANEVAVKAFLDGTIGFSDIPRLIKEQMQKHQPVMRPELDELLDLDRKIKKDTAKVIG